MKLRWSKLKNKGLSTDEVMMEMRWSKYEVRIKSIWDKVRKGKGCK